MAAVCVLQAGVATSVLGAGAGGGGGGGGHHDCRPDTSGASSSKTAGTSSSGGQTSGFDLSNGFLRPPVIPRFPPNIVRQLSIKARRNCSNIGVAQVVAASATDRPSLDAISALPQADVLEGQQLGSAHATAGASNFGIDTTLLSQAIAAPRNGILPVEIARPMARATLAVHGGGLFSLCSTEVKMHLSLLQSPEILRGQKRGLFPTVQACVVFARI